MNSAFISYCRKDDLVAHYLVKILAERGIDVFIDEHDLRPGFFWRQLSDQIEKRDFFIVLLSPDSVRSKWVSKEVAWAFHIKDEAKIIPIILSPLSNDDWKELFILFSFQQIDLTGWPQPDHVSQALIKLEKYMNLPSLPLTPIPRFEPFEEFEEFEGVEEEEEEPWLSLDDIKRLLETAQSTQNPPQALYLFRQAEESLHDFINRYEGEMRR